LENKLFDEPTIDNLTSGGQAGCFDK